MLPEQYYKTKIYRIYFHVEATHTMERTKGHCVNVNQNIWPLLSDYKFNKKIHIK